MRMRILTLFDVSKLSYDERHAAAYKIARLLVTELTYVPSTFTVLDGVLGITAYPRDSNPRPDKVKHFFASASDDLPKFLGAMQVEQ